MFEVTKQKFEYYLEKQCDERNNDTITFSVVPIKKLTDGYERIYYRWFKNDECIACEIIIKGCTRRIYEVKI